MKKVKVTKRQRKATKHRNAACWYCAGHKDSVEVTTRDRIYKGKAPGYAIVKGKLKKVSKGIPFVLYRG